ATPRTERLDVAMHSVAGKLWADWKSSELLFGCSEFVSGSGWSTVIAEPWNDPSWVGAEEVRKAIRAEVLAP
ncbi:MAG: hypothetical protein GY711_27445, partial [bacterium]|nr:hypothetical protein [bacterium]